MHHIKQAGLSVTNRLPSILKSYNGLCSSLVYNSTKCASDVGLAGYSSTVVEMHMIDNFAKRVLFKTGCVRSVVDSSIISKDVLGAAGNSGLLRGQQTRSPFIVTKINGANPMISGFARSFASNSSRSKRQNSSEATKDVSTVEDPFDAPTYNIPEKPMTFTEGASYSVVILAGLGIAAIAGYGVFKELIFEPKEYKVFGKALRRIQDDNRVSVRIGSPITGYGQESRNRAARQRIPNRTWKDNDGVEHVEVNFYIRGPQGVGKVFAEMFKDKVDKQWKFTYLQVEIQSPSREKIWLESYLPA